MRQAKYRNSWAANTSTRIIELQLHVSTSLSIFRDNILKHKFKYALDTLKGSTTVGGAGRWQ